MLDGGAGTDFIYAGTGNDTILGGSGIDYLYGEAGNDEIHGGSDYDIIFGGLGEDTIFGDEGNDYIFGESGNDTIYGGSGTDVLYVMQKKRIPVDDLWVRVEAKRRDEYPRIATEIHIHFTLIGSDIPPETVEHAIQLSQDKYCSVAGQIRDSADITTSFEVLTPEEARKRPGK